MTIDELGRAAGVRLREQTSEQAEAQRSLDDLLRRMRRRRQLRIAATAVSVAAAALVALSVSGRLTVQNPDGPTAPPAPTTGQAGASGDPCDLRYVTCDGDRPARIALRIPMTWQLPQDFKVTVSSFSIDHCCERPISVEALRTDVGATSRSGVTVLEDVQAAAVDQRAGPDTTVLLAAHTMATWLANRPDLDSSAVSRGTTGGLPSWTVTVRVADPDRQPAGSCIAARVNCTPILYLGELVDDPLAGMWGDMVSRFTFVELPEHDAAVVWSWTFGDESLLDGNALLLDSIRFEVPES